MIWLLISHFPTFYRSSSRGSDIGHPTTVSRRERGSSSNVDQTHSSVSSSGGGVSSHSTPYSAVSTVHSHASPATVGTSSAAVTAENSHAGTTSVTSSASQSVQSRQTVMAGGDSSLKDPASQQPPRYMYVYVVTFSAFATSV